MAQDKHGPRSRIRDGRDVLEFLRQAIVRTGFALAVAAAIHCTDGEVRRKQREQWRPTRAVSGASVNNQETRARSRAFDRDACSVPRTNEGNLRWRRGGRRERDGDRPRRDGKRYEDQSRNSPLHAPPRSVEHRTRSDDSANRRLTKRACYTRSCRLELGL